MTDKKSNLTPLAPENLVLVGGGNTSGTGNGIDNTITGKDAGNRDDSELRGKRRLKSRRWRDGDSGCANGIWRVAA